MSMVEETLTKNSGKSIQSNSNVAQIIIDYEDTFIIIFSVAAILFGSLCMIWVIVKVLTKVPFHF